MSDGRDQYDIQPHGNHPTSLPETTGGHPAGKIWETYTPKGGGQTQESDEDWSPQGDFDPQRPFDEERYPFSTGTGEV